MIDYQEGTTGFRTRWRARSTITRREPGMARLDKGQP